MPREWETLSLREAGVSLIDCDHRTPPAAESGYPYVAIPQLKQGRINLSDVRKITREHFVEWTRKANPKANDVILSRRCNPGETAVVPAGLECALGQNLVLLRADESKMFPPFLRWLVRGSDWWEQIGKFLNVGAIFDSLKCADIPNFRLPIPPLEEQRAIAHVLGTLDDKIELNRRLNVTLETLAQTIFKSWFLDVAASLPKGWREVPLPEAVEVNPARPLRKGVIAPYLDMANMPTRSARALEVVDREFGSGMRFRNGDTLVARITPCLENGKTCFVDFLNDGQIAWGSTEYIVLQPKPPLPPEFAYFLARTAEFRAFMISNMTGTSGRQRVPAECLGNFRIAVPPTEIAEEFGKFANSAFAQMKAHDEISRTLAALRDALLPKLLSGELRVPAK